MAGLLRRIPWGLPLAVLAAITVMLLPEQQGLPIAGQRMLAILAFAVVIWVSEALSYEVSAPQNMICIGTETFTSRQFTHTGIYLTLIGYALMLIMALTYWRWLGLL